MKVLILLVLATLISCSTDDSSPKIKMIGNCEYIVSHNAYGSVSSHKGDCKNPIHYKVIHDTIYVLKAQ